MGRGRATAALACLAGTAALMAGCGESEHANEPRPQVATRVSVTINPKRVLVRQPKVAGGPEKTQQIPQNQNQPQPPIKGDKRPLTVVFVAANLTDTDSRLTIRGAKDATSQTVLARSPSSFQMALPSGTYTISAADVPGARPAKLKIGDYRASSKNDLLLP